MLQVGRGDCFARRLPWIGPLLKWVRAATFLEVLALLVENQLPLPEALRLAAEASGDPATLRAARRLVAATELGQVRPSASDAAFPPLMNWLLLAAGRDGALLPALRHAAAAYQRRAQHQSDLLRAMLPVAADGRDRWNRDGVICVDVVRTLCVYASCFGEVTVDECVSAGQASVRCESSPTRRSCSLPRAWPN